LRTRVNTLINETNIQYEAATHHQLEILLFNWKKSHTKHVSELHEARESQFAHHLFLLHLPNFMQNFHYSTITEMVCQVINNWAQSRLCMGQTNLFN